MKDSLQQAATFALAALAATFTLSSRHRTPAAAATTVHAHGLWVWSTRDLLDAPQPLLDVCRKSGTTEVYIAVTHDLLADPRLATMVAQIERAHLRVEALMGDPTWYRSEKVPAMLSLIDDVLAFDARNASGFAAIHLDVEPHTLPENKGADVMTYLPLYIAAMQRAGNEAARGGLPIGADIPRKVLSAPEKTRRALTLTVPRLFLMLYELKHHAESDAVAASELGSISTDNLRFAYDPSIPHDGQMVIGISVADYADRLPVMRSAVDAANSANPVYGGWAIHDYAQLRATLK